MTSEAVDDEVRDWPLALGLRSRFVVMSDGTRLRVVEGGDERGTPVLFLHGAPQMAYEWRKILPHAATRAHVLAPDLRGYGASDLAGPGGYHLDRLVRDVEELLGELADQPAILVAHDWGAVVAWRFAELHPGRVRHLVLANAPLLEAFARELGRPSQLLRSWYVFLFQLPGVDRLIERTDADLLISMMRLSNRGAMDERDLAVYRASLAREGRAGAVLGYYRAARPRSLGALRAALRRPRITTPATLFWGTWDLCLAETHPRAIAPFASNLEIRRVEGVSHWLPEERPELLLDALSLLLEGDPQ